MIRAAGAVLWRRSGASLEVALVHRPRYDDWSLPKGKLDGSESIPEAAVREVHEETGYHCVLGHALLETSYTVAHGDVERPKTVQYFSARCSDGSFAANDEVDLLRWESVPAARALVSHDADRSVLDRFASLGVGLTTILLARHAKAVDKSTWDGDDDLRPLTDNGVQQAAALRRVVDVFAPDRVHSAPRLRCVQTVRAVAEELAVDVIHEPTLTEGAYRDAPAAAVDRVLSLAADGWRPVICSQGGVIPGVVEELALRGGLDLGDVEAKKGSVWALSFNGARLVSAYYIPPGA